MLPSGLAEKVFKFEVIENGVALQLTVYWPLPLINVDTLHQKWFRDNSSDRFKKYHPRCVAFDTAQKN